jgi:hypothetical protein
MSDLSSLIARVEAAAGPDREIDAEIDLAIFPDRRIVGDHVIDRMGFGKPVPHYTSSIDAALTLLPEGAGYNLQGAGDAHYAISAGHYSKKCPTPALALLSAILKARESSHEA